MVTCWAVPVLSLPLLTFWLPDAKGGRWVWGVKSQDQGSVESSYRGSHYDKPASLSLPLFSHFLAALPLSLSDRALGEPRPPPCCLWDACAPPSPSSGIKPRGAADRGTLA
jgi:hypothetical protein